MRTTCVRHPESEPIVMFRQWQVEACEGDICAAMLLSYFEYWHNHAIDRSKKAQQLNQMQRRIAVEYQERDESLLQWHTLKEIQAQLLNAYGRNKIIDGIKRLEALGFVSTQENPEPAQPYDRTTFFLFHADAVNQYLDTRGLDTDLNHGASQNKRVGFKNKPSIYNVVPEITTESISTEREKPLSVESATETDAPLKKKRGKREMSPVPEDLDPSPSLKAWHQQKYPDIDLQDAIEACLTWHRSKGQRAANYEAAVQTWIRRGINLKKLPPGQRRLEVIV